MLSNTKHDQHTSNYNVKVENHAVDSNDSSDSERLQMDVDEDNNKAHNTIVGSDNQITDRETPESMTSDDQQGVDGTDPATTQLWQALAHTTGKFWKPISM